MGEKCAFNQRVIRVTAAQGCEQLAQGCHVAELDQETNQRPLNLTVVLLRHAN